MRRSEATASVRRRRRELRPTRSLVERARACKRGRNKRMNKNNKNTKHNAIKRANCDCESRSKK
eukprot:5941213-Pleurochrysis_carterae.AAC.1